ncbi:MAG: hypothetical protein JJT75_12205 [Opitutales bacterium]|nr:hypothetical protein [Opitutales bacterium]MCH8540244.1 hypothetical protein [Opitutales bacterium]
MRDFLQEKVLWQSLPVATVVALLAAPRIAQGPFEAGVWYLVLFAWAVSMLAAGAVFAWGRKGGLAGPFPGHALHWWPMLLAFGLGSLMALLFMGMDTFWRPLLARSPEPSLEYLAYPRNWNEWVRLVLWNIGFMTLFFTAAAMAVFARVSRRWVVALLVVVFLRFIASIYRLQAYDMGEFWPVALITTVPFSILACWLYARHGFPAVIAFTLTKDVRHLFRDDFVLF